MSELRQHLVDEPSDDYHINFTTPDAGPNAIRQHLRTKFGKWQNLMMTASASELGEIL
jgi:hypothetical protein